MKHQEKQPKTIKLVVFFYIMPYNNCGEIYEKELSLLKNRCDNGR